MTTPTADEPTGLDALIAGLQIFREYGNPARPARPTHCEHDELTICGIDPADVVDEDKARLAALGFYDDKKTFYSHRFGSA